jgi:hypothetical protein
MSTLDQDSATVQGFTNAQNDQNSLRARFEANNIALGFTTPGAPARVPNLTSPGGSQVNSVTQGAQPSDPASQPDSSTPQPSQPDQAPQAAGDNTQAPPTGSAETPPVDSDWETLKGAGELIGQGAQFVGRAAYDSITNPKQFASGAFHTVQNVANSVMDATDAVSKWMQSAGVTAASFDSTQHQASFADSTFDPPQTPEEKLAYGTGQFAAQFAAFAAAPEIQGAGKLAAVGGRLATGMAVNFSAFDPHQAKLADMLDQNPALHNSFMKYFASNPSDSNALDRFKQSINGLVSDSLLAGALASIGKAYKVFNGHGAQALAEDAQAAAKAGMLQKGSENQILDTTIPPRQAAAGDAKAAEQLGAQTPSPQNDLPPLGEGEQISSPAQAPGRADEALAGKEPITPEQVLQPRAPSELSNAGPYSMEAIERDQDVQQTVKNIIEHHADSIEEAKRGIMKDTDLVDKAGRIAATDAQRILGFPVGRAMSAEELAATSILMNQGAKELAIAAEQVINTGASSESLANFASIRSNLSKITVQWGAARSEAGRALRATGVLAGEDELKAAQMKIAQELSEANKNPREAVSTAAKIKQVLDQQNIDKVRWLGNFLAKSQGMRLADAATEVWTAAMLSNPTTAVKILAAGASTTIMSPLQRAGSYAINVMKNTYQGLAGKPISEGISRQEVGQSIIGLMHGLQDGFQLGVETIKGNHIPGRMTGTPSLARAGENALQGRLFQGDNPISKGLAFLSNAAGNFAQKPLKLIATAHDMIRTVNFRMEVEALAARRAAGLGLTGEAFEQQVNKIIADPPADIHLMADNNSRETSFAAPLTGAAKSFQQMVRSIPLFGKVIAPFTNVAGNIVNYSLNRNPIFASGVGLASAAGWKGIGQEMQEEFAAGGIRANVQEGKIAAGTLLMSLGAWMKMSGKMTGSYSADPKMRKLEENAGFQPHSIPFHHEDGSTTYVPFHALEGIGPLLQMSADLTQIFPYMTDEQKKGDYAAAAAALVFRQATPDFIFDRFGKALNAMNNPGKDSDSFLTAFGRTLIPSIAGAADRAFFDPLKRVTKPDASAAHPFWQEFFNQAKTQIPGLSSTLPPQRDAIDADPIYYPDGYGPDTLSGTALINPFKATRSRPDPVRDEMIRLGMTGAFAREEAPPGENSLSVGLPSQTITRRDPYTYVDLPIHLTNEQYDKYQQLCVGKGLRTRFQDDSGNNIPIEEREKTMPTLRENLEAQISQFDANKLNDIDRRTEIASTISRYRTMARMQILAEDKDLQLKAMQMDAASRASKLTPGPGANDKPTLEEMTQ